MSSSSSSSPSRETHELVGAGGANENWERWARCRPDAGTVQLMLIPSFQGAVPSSNTFPLGFGGANGQRSKAVDRIIERKRKEPRNFPAGREGAREG